MSRWLCAACMAILIEGVWARATPAAAPAATGVRVLADFEAEPARVLDLTGWVASADADAAVGKGALRLAVRGEPPPGPVRAAAWLPVQGWDGAKVRELTVWLRARSDEKTVRLRLVAADEGGRQIFQRRVEIPSQAPAGQWWHHVRLPLHVWRWGNTAVGSWSEVRRLGVLLESPASDVWVDDVQLLPDPRPAPDARAAAAGRKPESDWLAKVAFGDRDARLAEADGLLVGTDAMDGVAEADVARMLSNMRKVRAMVSRLFGPAVRPIDTRTPSALLVFRDNAAYVRFWTRLGEEWAVGVAIPTAGGFTVQDVSSSTYDPKLGADRPVFLHESVHAVLGHDLRLLTGADHHWWLHEGLANYVQLCLYPHSLDPAVYPREFARGIPPEGPGLFRPLKEVMGPRGMPRQYAQLACVMAYLVEEKPQWLPMIAKSLADGETTEQALKRCGTTFDELEAAWLAWGKQKFPKPRVAGEPPFKVPAEWAPGPATRRLQPARP